MPVVTCWIKWLVLSAVVFGALPGPGDSVSSICCTLFVPHFCSPTEAPRDVDELAGGFMLRTLKSSTVALGMEDDADGKDTSVLDRLKYKPSKGSEEGLDKRFGFRAKKDGAKATVLTERDAEGDGDVFVRVAVDSDRGLVSGTSLGFLEFRPADGGAVSRVEAVWEAELDGFSLRARVDGELMGSSVPFAATHELFLIVSVSSGSVTLFAADALGDGPRDQGPWQSLGGPGELPPAAAWRVGLGVEGLQRKGVISFAQLTFASRGAAPGEAESSVLFPLVSALEWTSTLEHLSTFGGSGDPGFFLFTALFAADLLDQALVELENQGTAGSLDPDTSAKSVKASLLKARGLLNKVAAKAGSLQDHGNDMTSVLHPLCKKAHDQAHLAAAQLLGFRQRSPGKLAKSIVGF